MSSNSSGVARIAKTSAAPSAPLASQGTAETSLKTRAPAPLWRCSFDQVPPDIGGAPLDQLTVGAKFQMNCQGEIAIPWKDGEPQIVFAKPEEEKYSLVILKTVRKEERATSYIVTSYKAGEHNPEYLRVLTGDQGFETSGLQWAVQSVLPKDKKPEPYPSRGPFLMPLPIWIWGFVLLGVLLIGWVGWRLVRRTRQRRKVREILSGHASALPPHTQFHKDLRQIKKAIESQTEPVETSAKLDTEFRLYLLRAFEIPTLDWSDSEILRDLKKKNHALYASEAKRLAKCLRELGQLRKNPDVKAHDLEQMFKLCRDTVDRIEKVRGVHK